MIFDSYNESASVSLDAIKESPYALGYEGALMHVYENEINYYSLMKAVGLSEMKYYQETGGSLFVHEAGAFGSFIEKVKAFFKKVIEKIKSIFKKFIAAIDQYTLENKKFVKKYGQEIMRKNLTDFEFEGYEFKSLNDASSKFTGNCKAIEDAITDLENAHDTLEKGINSTYKNDTQTISILNASIDIIASMSSEQKTAAHEIARGLLIGETGNKRLDSDDYRDRLQELFYGDGKDGDKTTLENINMRDQLNYIDDGKKTIKDVEKKQRDTTKHIENALKKLDKLPEQIRKYTKSDEGKTAITTASAHQFKTGSDVDNTKVENYIKVVNNGLDLCRSLANDITVGFGVLVQAYKDRVTQAKAICVKALSYKHESARLESYNNYDSDDIFSGVNII